jgi:hypothetical protein
MEAVAIFRLSLIPAALVTLSIILRLVRPPRSIFLKALSISWIVFFLVALVEIVAANLRISHNVMPPLFFGLTPDIYLAGTISFGIGGPLLFWWVKRKHRKCVLPLVVLLPILGFSFDCLVGITIGKALFVADVPLELAYLFDFVCWTLSAGFYLFVFNRSLGE